MIKTKTKRGRPEKDETEKRDKFRVTATMTETEKAEVVEAVRLISSEYKIPEAVWARKVLLEAARAVIASSKKK